MSGLSTSYFHSIHLSLSLSFLFYFIHQTFLSLSTYKWYPFFQLPSHFPLLYFCFLFSPSFRHRSISFYFIHTPPTSSIYHNLHRINIHTHSSLTSTYISYHTHTLSPSLSLSLAHSLTRFIKKIDLFFPLSVILDTNILDTKHAKIVYSPTRKKCRQIDRRYIRTQYLYIPICLHFVFPSLSYLYRYTTFTDTSRIGISKCTHTHTHTSTKNKHNEKKNSTMEYLFH